MLLPKASLLFFYIKYQYIQNISDFSPHPNAENPNIWFHVPNGFPFILFAKLISLIIYWESQNALSK